MPGCPQLSKPLPPRWRRNRDRGVGPLPLPPHEIMVFSTKEVFRGLNESFSPPSSPRAIKAAVCTGSQQKLPQRGHQGTSQEGEQKLQNTLEKAPRKASSQPGRFCPSHTLARGATSPSRKDTMSTESMIRDVELAEEALPKKTGGLQNSRRCLCLSLFSFLLVAGATTLFCLLNFGVIGPQKDEVSVWAVFLLTHKQSRVGGPEGQGEGKRGLMGRVMWRTVGRETESGPQTHAASGLNIPRWVH